MHSTKDTLQVLYEDNHLFIVNKRAGDIVQGDKTGDLPLSEIAKQYIAEKYQKPGAVFLGVVHRLDRPTSGIVVFARTSKALSRLNKIFAERQAKKTYWAVVKKPPVMAEDRLVHFLKRNPKQNKSYAYEKEVAESKRAVLNYKVIKTLHRYSLLEIDLETGRHHQIRSQLSFIGSPIKGDPEVRVRQKQSRWQHSFTRQKIGVYSSCEKRNVWLLRPPRQTKPFGMPVPRVR